MFGRFLRPSEIVDPIPCRIGDLAVGKAEVAHHDLIRVADHLAFGRGADAGLVGEGGMVLARETAVNLRVRMALGAGWNHATRCDPNNPHGRCSL